MRRSLLAILLCGCGAAAPAPTPPAVELPSVEGLAIYPAPIDEAPPPVRALLAQLPTVLAHRLTPPADTSLRGIQAWSATTLAEYLREHIEHIEALEASASELAGDDLVVAAIVLATAYDDFVTAIESIPTPDEIADAPELRRTFRDALANVSGRLAQHAAAAYSRCASAELPEPMRAWAPRCEERARVLAAIEPPPERPAEPAAQPPIPWPTECEGADSHQAAPEAPPPDRGRPEVIAIVLSDDVELEEREQLLETARARVDALVDGRVLPARDVLAAERLRAERRVRRRGPVCGQPPPLAWVLREQHPNVVIGTVERMCIHHPSREPSCSLDVRFHRPGSDEPDGLPPLLSGELANDTPAAWLDAAARLEVAPPRALVVGFLRGAPRELELRVRDDEDESPWLRLRSLLDQQTDAFTTCLPEGTAASFRASFDVSAVGDPSGISVDSRTNASEEASACVQRALETMRWPCTPEARSQRVEVTLCLRRPAD